MQSNVCQAFKIAFVWQSTAWLYTMQEDVTWKGSKAQFYFVRWVVIYVRVPDKSPCYARVTLLSMERVERADN
ncbi:hypothetical protein GCM10011507_26350 [Edaphobacter acidisoli]|uniref:Uncharacterized protein n=1 Tax=Edaphobacter acidisoli TaxID=2040573 RepID=A0A916RYD9_9BACT|nr:hypothetical protein GCM10011507_26350 [Edaphobacter acidisoli]